MPVWENILAAVLWPLLLTQPLTEMSTRNLPGAKARLARKADNLTATREPIFYNIRQPRRLTTVGASMACYGDFFTYFYHRKRLTLSSSLVDAYVIECPS
jgi:hypothetical protein